MQFIHSLFTLQICISQEENCGLLSFYANSNSNFCLMIQKSAVLIYCAAEARNHACISQVLPVFKNKLHLILTVHMLILFDHTENVGHPL
jgi:hypothetical protein